MLENLSDFEVEVSQAVDAELRKYIESTISNNSDLQDIFLYHLGLQTQTGKKGKRVRPVLTTLCAAGAGADWTTSIPVACAIELVHNFSLIHDDIEDNGELRRGKEAVWKKWGLEKGINAGDAMFAAAFDLLSTNSILDPVKTNQCLSLLSQTCLALTEGQELDIDFEQRDKVFADEYFRMVEGKTAALIACCARGGALIGGLPLEMQDRYETFGKDLGIAFQILDDWLGVWGDPKVTGKSAISDLTEKKKSYPVILGLERSKDYSRKWSAKFITANNAVELAAILTGDGIKDEVEKEFKRWNEKALNDLEELDCRSEIKGHLRAFTDKLLIRDY